MPKQDSSNLDEIMVEVYRAIHSALESRLHLIGSVIDVESRKEILAQQICDKSDFYVNTGYLLQTTDTAMILTSGKCELTQSRWQEVMGSNPATGYGSTSDRPV